MMMCQEDVDLLPIDPFGMELNISLAEDPFRMNFNLDATVAAISGWIDEFGLNTYGIDVDEALEDICCEDNKISIELRFMRTRPLEYGQKEGDDNVVVNTCSLLHLDDERHILDGDMKELIYFGCEKYRSELENDCNYDCE